MRHDSWQPPMLGSQLSAPVAAEPEEDLNPLLVTFMWIGGVALSWLLALGMIKLVIIVNNALTALP